jgi:hypothetical protein
VKQHLNLLPWRLRCRMLLRRRIRQWAVLWMILVVVTTGLGLWSWQSLGDAERDRDTWARRAVTIQSIHNENEALQRQVAALRERFQKYGHLESEQLGYQLLATISQTAASGSAGGNSGETANDARKQSSIQIQKLVFKQTEVQEKVADAKTATKNAKTPPKMRTVRTVSLTGVATNNLAVAQFVSSLRDSGAFLTVDLKSSQGNKLASATDSRAYQVECSF